MCGRFVAASPPDEIAKYFGAETLAPPAEPTGTEGAAPFEASFNVAPSNDVVAVLERGGTRHLELLHWGLVPMWAKDLKVGYKMINARAETVLTKNAYKRAFHKRRCIIPADGFFEWKVVPGQKAKQPMYIHRVDGEPFAFAGLWEVWRGPDRDAEEVLRSCTIITGLPNEKVATVHDRMPVMLPPSAWAAWLDPDNDDVEELAKLLVPAPAELMEIHPVSTAVNNVRQKGPELIEPVARDESVAGGGVAPDGQATLL
jgi:putative SOS response-associated peptidase YedK